MRGVARNATRVMLREGQVGTKRKRGIKMKCRESQLPFFVGLLCT
jgi:hypothetical protein